MPSSLLPCLRSVVSRLHLKLVTVLGSALLSGAGGLTASAQTTFTCSTESGSNCALQLGSSQTSSSSSSFTVPTAGTIKTISVELNGVWSKTNSSNFYSMQTVSFLLTGPGGEYELLGGTGDGADGADDTNNYDDPANGLHGLNIIIQDGASPAPMGCGDVCNNGEVNAWPEGNGTTTGNTTGNLGSAGTTTDTVKPGSYFGYDPSDGSNPPPLGVAGDWPDTDGCNPDPILTSYNNATNCSAPTLTTKYQTTAANGTWTLTLISGDGVTTPISITNWSLTFTYATAVGTSTAISSSANPSNASNTVTFTATVTSSGGTPTGSASFTANGVAISGCTGKALSGGVTTCATTLGEGNNSIEASYTPTGSFGSSNSTMNQLVEVTPSQSGNKWCNTSQIVAPGNTAGVQYPSFIHVSGYPGGSTVGGNLTVELVGATGPSGVNAYHLLVAPGGQNLDFFDSAFAYEQPSSPVNLTIYDAAGQTPSGSSAPTTGSYDPYDNNINGIVNDGFPTSASPGIDSSIPQVPGTINRASPLAGTSYTNFQQAFSGASANGDWALYTYAGGGENETIESGWCVTFDINTGVSTTTSVAASPNPQTTGQTATITATVTAGGNAVTSGTVTFLDGGATPAGTVGGNNVVALNGAGQAAFASSSLAEGDHTFTATYNGTSNDNGSYGTVVQRINDATTLYANGATIANGPTCGATYCYCNAGPISTTASYKGAFTPNPSIISTSGLPGTISSVTLGLNQYSSASTILYALESMVVGPTGADLDYFSNAGYSSGGGTASLGNYIFSDSASSGISSSVSTLSPGTYKPSSFVEGDSANWPEPTQPYFSGYYTPPSAITYAAPRGSGTFTGQFENTNPDGLWSVYMTEDDPAGAASAAHGWCVNFTENPVTVSVALSHQGDGTGIDFVQGESSAHIITVVEPASNTGPTGDPFGNNPLKVVDTLNSALTYTGYTGTGWSCSYSSPTVTCSNDASVGESQSYPTLTFNVNVSSSAPGSIGNSVSVSGAGITNNSGSDTITVDATPAVAISKSHTGNFLAGSTGVWTLTVSNTAAGSATSGVVSVSDALPTGYSLASYTSTGNLWNCSGSGTVSCSATPGITGGSNATINLTVNVPANSPTSVSNTAYVWGGGDTVHTSQGSAAVSNTDTATADAPPAITSANSATFNVGTFDSFTATATGDPTPTFSESGALPSGVTMSTGGVLSGTPAALTGGSYPITITATNGVSPDATQSFTLTNDQAPVFTGGNSATMTVLTSNAYLIFTSGYPIASISESGTLPSGVTFVDDGNGHGTLSGSPASTTGGVYPITFTANNGISPNGTLNYTLTIKQPTSITSANNATFTAATAGTFTVTTSGYPAPSISQSGTMPSGVNFVDNGNGTATISGTPPVGSGGAYSFTISANNGVGGGSQTFTLTVDEAPVITSNSSATFNTGAAGSFTVTTTGYPTPGFNESGPMPNGVTFVDNNNGTATLSGTPVLGSAGSYPITIQAGNGIGTNAMQSFALTVTPPPAYVVTTVNDDSTGTPSNCPIPSTGNTCTLRDALAASASAGSGVVTFDPGTFGSAQTITLTNGTLNVPPDTSVTGATTGSGASLSDLVSVSGNNATTVFSIASGVTGASIANLNITSGSNTSGNGGGIYNNGTLTVTGSSITANAAQNGGGVYNDASGVLGITSSSIDGNQAQDGAGIATSGALNLSRSTISGNTSSQYAGGIADNGATTLANCTVSGNEAAMGGGGIASQTGGTALDNSIVSGNTGPSSAPDDIDSSSGNGYANLGGNVVGVVNGSAVNGSAISLASLSPNGGPTQTMLPEPGSPAICAGLMTGLNLTGTFTDQRGDPNTNITYMGYAEGNPCVDSGSVQTNYAMGFSAEPPSSEGISVTFNPAPVVSLTESNAPIALNVGTVTMTDTANLLAGTLSALISSGAATFSNLNIPSATTGDLLNATLPLTGSINLTAQSTAVDINAEAAVLLTPTPGLSTILGTSNVQFTWSSGAGVSSYQLRLGIVGVGTGSIFKSGVLSGTSVNVPVIPAQGVTVFAQLGSLINGTWQYTNFVYTEAGTPAAATLSPSSGTLATSQKFTWSNGVGPAAYQLYMGTIGPGSSDLYNSNVTVGVMETVTIPSNGVTVYATLNQLIDGTWQATRYTFTEPGTTTPATLTPSSGTLSASQLFDWSNGAGPASYILWVGTTGPGSSDVYNSHETTTTSATVSIPSNGVVVYATLKQLIDGTWQSTSYTFTEPGLSPATLTPSTGTLSASQTFTWTNGVGPAAYQLWLGTQGQGSSNIYNSGRITATSATVTIPSNGVTVYATLYQYISGTWQPIYYTFTEPGTQSLATLTPSSGTLSSSQLFTWSNGVGPASYQLWLGTKGANSSDLYNSGATKNTSVTLAIPSNGVKVYATLWQLINGTWQSAPYTFTEP